MSVAPHVSVIIPHLNQPEFLTRALASLGRQSGDVPSFEVLVVDNGSGVLPHDVIEEFPFARLLQEAEPGPGPARNKGVSEARGEILAFTDADCLIHEGWLARIAAYFEAHGDVHAAGGDVFIDRADPDNPTPLEAYEGVFAFRTREYIEKQDFTATNNLVVRASAMKAVGPFGGKDIAEDREWGQRGARLGYPTVYAADMIVYHPARATFAELCKKWDRHTSHDFVDYQKKSLWRLKWLARTAAMAVSPVAEIPRILRSDRIHGARERWLAFRVLLRIRFYRVKIMLGLLLRGGAAGMSGAWNS